MRNDHAESVIHVVGPKESTAIDHMLMGIDRLRSVTDVMQDGRRSQQISTAA